jgi:hypothetical protein
VNGLKDSGTVIGDRNLLAGGLVSAHGDENLIHALGAEGGLDEICDSDSADEGLLQDIC